MKVYISGKITGDENYKEKFAAAEKKLRNMGYEVFNPAVMPNMFDWKDFMEIDLKILSLCDVIYLLDDWTSSRGACMEKKEADRLGIPYVFESENVFGDALVKLCEDTEMVLDYPDCCDDEEYKRRMQQICRFVRFSVHNFDILKSDEENFSQMVERIPEEERKFFFREFIRDGYVQFEYDRDEDCNSLEMKRKYNRLIAASRKMSIITESLCCEEEKVSA